MQFFVVGSVVAGSFTNALNSKNVGVMHSASATVSGLGNDVAVKITQSRIATNCAVFFQPFEL